MKKNILSLIIITSLAAIQAGGAATTTAKPNILHIHADDHRPDGLHALGNPVG